MERRIKQPSALGGKCEGSVTRVAKAIKEEDFQEETAKYVRKGHVQIDEHWSKNWKAAKLTKK